MWHPISSLPLHSVLRTFSRDILITLHTDFNSKHRRGNSTLPLQLENLLAPAILGELIVYVFFRAIKLVPRLFFYHQCKTKKHHYPHHLTNPLPSGSLASTLWLCFCVFTGVNLMLKLMALPTRTTGVSSCLNTSQLFLIQLVHFESAALSRAKHTHKHAHTDTQTHTHTHTHTR